MTIFCYFIYKCFFCILAVGIVLELLVKTNSAQNEPVYFSNGGLELEL